MKSNSLKHQRTNEHVTDTDDVLLPFINVLNNYLDGEIMDHLNILFYTDLYEEKTIQVYVCACVYVLLVIEEKVIMTVVNQLRIS